MENRSYRLEIREVAGLPTYHLFRDDDRPRPLVVYGHGYRGSVRNHVERLYMLADAGFYAFALEAEHHGLRADLESLRLLDSSRNSHSADLFFTLLLQQSAEIAKCLEAMAAEPGSPADLARVGVLGVSMGGYLAFHLAAQEERVKVICPLLASPKWRFEDSWSGTGLTPETEARTLAASPHRRPEAYRGKAIQMHNGTADKLIPIAGARRLWRDLSARDDCTVELYTYKEDHEVQPPMLRRSLAFLRRHLLDGVDEEDR